MDYRKMRETPLENVATVHPTVNTVLELFKSFRTFDAPRWAFRGQGTDRALTASIERVVVRPGIAEDYLMREFRRRAHHYVADVPRDDLEWLALMQHHGVPTRLVDWTRSAHIAAFFAAQSSNSANPFVTTKREQRVSPFVIWAIDVDSVNAEAAAILGLPECNNDLSSPENFRKVYWDPPPNDVYLVAGVQPYRMNERLTIQQGLFLFANHVLFPFRNCLAALLLHASESHKPSAQWLHKIAVAAEIRLEVLAALHKINMARRFSPVWMASPSHFTPAFRSRRLQVGPGFHKRQTAKVG